MGSEMCIRDSTLSDRGMRQVAFKLSCKSKDLCPGGQPVHLVFCSPLKRAILTALAFTAAKCVVLVPGLAEVRTGYGMNAVEMAAWFAESGIDGSKFDLSMLNPEWASNLAKETESAARARVNRTLTAIQRYWGASEYSKGTKIAIVSHLSLIHI